MLQIRDDAFAKLGDTNLADREVQGSAPTFTVDKVERPAARRLPGRRGRHRAPRDRPHDRCRAT